MKERQRQNHFWMTYPELLSGHVQMPDPLESLRAHCVHFCANILVLRDPSGPSSRAGTWSLYR